MPKPDAEEYARKVLWHICGLRAEVRSLHNRFADFLASQSDDEAEEVQKKWLEECRQGQEKLYLEALKEVGLQNPKPTEGEDLRG